MWVKLAPLTQVTPSWENRSDQASPERATRSHTGALPAMVALALVEVVPPLMVAA